MATKAKLFQNLLDGEIMTHILLTDMTVSTCTKGDDIQFINLHYQCVGDSYLSLAAAEQRHHALSTEEKDALKLMPATLRELADELETVIEDEF